jgi:multicomponent Na+:H+ antiporter subunit E
MSGIKAFVLSVLLLLSIWVLMIDDISNQEIGVGLGVSVLLSLLFARHSKILQDFKLNPKAIGYFFIFLCVFFYELIKSNIDVAFRVINPKLPINPGIVRVKTKLKSRLGRLMLANSITLTPGTLTLETKGDVFYIHWIDVSSENIDDSTEKIVKKFEKYLEVIVG